MPLSNTDYKVIYNKTKGDPNHPVIQKLSKNPEYSYQFARILIKNNKEVPDIIVQSIAEDSEYSYYLSKFLIKNNKEIPVIIVQAIARNSYYSYHFAKDLIERDKEVPDIILQSIAENSAYSYEFAKLLIQNNEEVPDIIVQSIAEDSEYSYYFANYLIQNKKQVPDIIKKAARQYNDDLPELKENYFYKLYGNLLTENILFKVYNKLVGGDKVNMIKGGALGSTGVNYTNSDGVEVTLKDEDIEIAEFNGEEYLGDIEINYIGISNIKNRGKGLASKELDRILSVADSMDLSVSILIDPEEATKGGGVVGMFYNQLKSWYEKKGFIFDGRLGYRPKKSENREEIKPKKIYVSKDKIKQIEDQINSSEIKRNFSDPDSLFEITLFQRKDLIGYLEGGNDRVYFYDGKNRPVIVANVKSKFDYKSNKFVISLIDNYMESYKD